MLNDDDHLSDCTHRRSPNMSPWRYLSYLVVMVTWITMVAVPPVATAVDFVGNVTHDDFFANQNVIVNHLLRTYQFIFGPSSSSSSLTSTLPIVILFDDKSHDYYFRHPNGQLQRRSGLDESRLVKLMKLSTLKQNQADPKPVVKLLVDLFHRRQRLFTTVDDGPEMNDSVLNFVRRPLEQDDEIELLLFLADVVDRTLHTSERREHGESASAASDVGFESRLERVAADLQVVVNETDADPERDAIRRMDVHISEDNETMPLWMQFENNINQYELYSKEDEPMVDDVVRLLTTLPVIGIGEISAGTNLKLAFTNVDNSVGLFKPKRNLLLVYLLTGWGPPSGTLTSHSFIITDAILIYSTFHVREYGGVQNDAIMLLSTGARKGHDRYYEVPLEVPYYRETERHLAEIAAYHLDRSLGFRRVPPVSGVRVAFTEQMRELLPPQFQATFFESPGGNVCFFGKCALHCETESAVCGTGTLVEGSLAYFLPNNKVAEMDSVESPWRRSYTSQMADWEITEKSAGYCDAVRNTPPFDSERALVNLIDLHIFDFLQGNQDRHHSHRYTVFGDDSFIVTYDNGRGFGRAHHDELSILAPLYQCCAVRLSTVKTLLDLQISPSSSPSSSSGGGRLSDRMRRSLSSDPLSPVLSDAHLEALDRRVGIVLDQIHQCLQRSDGSRQVIVDY